MDDPRYVIVVMLDEPKATKDTYGFTTAGWNVAPVVSRTVSRIAPMLGVAARHEPRTQHGRGLALRSRNEGVTSRCACPTSRTSIAIPKSPALPSTIARSRAEACSAPSRARCSTARISSASGRSRRGRSRRAAGSESERVPHLADPEPRRLFADLAAKFYAPYPETVVAVTGTNGKTSTVEMTRQIWRMSVIGRPRSARSA